MIPRARSGEMRHPVAVQARTTNKGDGGEPLDTWTTVFTIRCRVWPVKGKESEESRRETGKLMCRFFTRYQAGITIGMRLVFNGRYFDIISAANVGEMGRELEITAMETI